MPDGKGYTCPLDSFIFRCIAEAATKKLADLTRQGVHAARVVTLTAPTIVRHLQVRAVDPAWHHAAGAQRFNSCPLDEASST